MRLKELRTQKGLTQKELGAKLGFRQSSITAWENGISEPSFETACKLAEILDCSIDYLIGYSDDFGNVQGAERGEQLTPAEMEMLREYRALSPSGREQIKTLAEFIKTAENKKK